MRFGVGASATVGKARLNIEYKSPRSHSSAAPGQNVMQTQTSRQWNQAAIAVRRRRQLVLFEYEPLTELPLMLRWV